MLNRVTVHNNGRTQERVQDAELLKRSGVHKLVITDQEGNCLAFVLAWDSFDYDAETDTYVCVADSDGRELVTIYTAGIDVDTTPKLRTFLNYNYIRLNRTEPVELLLFQPHIRHDIDLGNLFRKVSAGASCQATGHYEF